MISIYCYENEAVFDCVFESIELGCVVIQDNVMEYKKSEPVIAYYESIEDYEKSTYVEENYVRTFIEGV